VVRSTLRLPWFDQHRLNPAYPFGFGLSWTRFLLSHLRASSTSVTLTLRNTRRRSGQVVPEIYLRLRSTKAVPEPPAPLAGYDRVTLASGQAQTATTALQARSCQYWNTASSSWAAMPGCVTVLAGTSSRNLLLTARIKQRGATCRSAHMHHRARKSLHG
jgi:beta-glucosidase